MSKLVEALGPRGCKTQTELDKRIDDELESIWNGESSLVEYKFKNFDNGFRAGAKFIPEMPELREFLKRSINLVRNNLSHFDDCNSLYDEGDTCSCGLDIEKQWFDKALAALRELGVVE